MRIFLRLLSLAALIAPVAAEEPVEDTAISNPDDIESELVERDLQSGRWTFGLLEKWSDAQKAIQEETGVSWTVSYHSVALASFFGNDVPFGSSGDLTFQGIWRIGHRFTDNPTQLRFRLRHRHKYSSESASQLTDEIGSLWGVVDGFSNSGFEIPDLFLRHQFKDPNLEIRYGQLSIDSQFGGHQLASSKRYFLNQGFASDPAVAFPRFGAGLTALLRFDNGFSLGAGTTTVQGTQTGDQVDLNFGSSDFFHAIQFAYDYTNRDDLAERLQLMVWHSDPVEDANRPDGHGLTLTYERVFDEAGTRGFARLSWSEGGASDLNLLLAAGIARPCGEADLGGLAAGVGRSSGLKPGSENDVQAVFEAFYRWQVTERLQVTPDAQLLIGRGFNGSPGMRILAGLRFGITF